VGFTSRGCSQRILVRFPTGDYGEVGYYFRGAKRREEKRLFPRPSVCVPDQASNLSSSRLLRGTSVRRIGLWVE
jgi:hypothetical protein